MRRFPRIGATRDWLGAGLRVVFQQPYAIYYLPTPEALIVVRVLHGARDLVALTARGAFL